MVGVGVVFGQGVGRFEGSRGAGALAGVVGVVFGQGVVFRVRRQRKTAMVWLWSSVVDGWCDYCEGCGGTRMGHTGTRSQKKRPISVPVHPT